MLEAFVDALQSTFGMQLQILEYGEHALSQHANAEAVTYLQLKYENRRYTGIAIDKRHCHFVSKCAAECRQSGTLSTPPAGGLNTSSPSATKQRPGPPEALLSQDPGNEKKFQQHPGSALLGT
jgi:hypothetical protein